MNVLLLSQFLSTTKGGGEYVFSLMAKMLAENNHNVWIITNRISGEQYPSNENIKIITVSPTLQYEGGLPTGFSDNPKSLLSLVGGFLKNKLLGSRPKSGKFIDFPSVTITLKALCWIVKNLSYIKEKRRWIKSKRVLSTNEAIKMGLITN